MARLQDYYRETIVPQLKEKFGYKSVMQVPRITKITLNMGVGEAVGDKKVMDHAMNDHGDESPVRKPLMRRARKSVATFKIRDGYPDWLQGHAAS